MYQLICKYCKEEYQAGAVESTCCDGCFELMMEIQDAITARREAHAESVADSCKEVKAQLLRIVDAVEEDFAEAEHLDG